jgi:hypothetical protein
MRGINRWVLILLLIVAVVAIVLILVTMIFTQITFSAEFFEGTTNLMLVAEVTEGKELECEGLNVVVLYKEGIVKQGETIMNNCGLSIFNCGPGPVDLAQVWIEWRMGNYYSGSGSLGGDILNENDVKLVGCTEVFGTTPAVADIATQEFVIDKIPTEVRIYGPTGTAWDNWEVTYISEKGMV